MTPTGLLGSTDLLLPDLPRPSIVVRGQTQSAHSFDPQFPNAGAGVHDIKGRTVTDTKQGDTGANVGAAVGSARLVIESVRLVND